MFTFLMFHRHVYLSVQMALNSGKFLNICHSFKYSHSTNNVLQLFYKYVILMICFFK